MNPRFVAVSGPLKGSVFPLAADEVTLGRLESNLIVVPDMAVSRHHCVIRRESDRFKLVDLGSHNGCYVNAVPVKEHDLLEGDRVGIGESQFVFRVSEKETSASGTVELNEDRILAGRTIRLRREDAVRVKPESVLATATSAARPARDLQASLKVSQIISTSADLDALAEGLLVLMLELVRADRAAILLGEGNNGEFETAFGRDRRTGSAGPVPVSRTLARRALEERAGLLYNDVSQDVGLREADSVVASLISAVLVVPIPGRGKPSGVIYLAISDPAGRFEEGDLHLITSIAELSGASFESARTVRRLETENERLQGEIEVNYKMVGRSPAMQEVYRFIARVAKQNSTVLITGESGTGKELVARALHANSTRAPQPFAAVNCAVLMESLFESELFGHEKGAFTGAVATKKGKIEVAEGGTLFLDEIAEMAPRLQAKLLRVLQEREFERVGGVRTLKADIRVIVATNRDLEQEIQRGNFRQDLFFRLNVVAIHVPPLKERREDIMPLANYFVTKHCRQAKRQPALIAAETQACLKAYDWPGNVRELENALEHAVVLGAGDLIRPEELPEAILEVEPASGQLTRYHEAVRQAKKDVILKAYERAGGSYNETAKMLGIHVNYLHRLIRTLSLKASLKHADGHADAAS
ncbi:MAG TPA: sigma 54-interacting transcriptional regulator [Terriglobia bacterium]